MWQIQQVHRYLLKVHLENIFQIQKTWIIRAIVISETENLRFSFNQKRKWKGYKFKQARDPP